MEGYMWLILASMFAVGIVIGYFLSRGKGDDVKAQAKIRELQQNLDHNKNEIQAYKQEVAEHFGTTAELVNELTNNYRKVYEHLAQSSEKLCGDQPVVKLKSLASAESPLLEGESEKVAEPAEAEHKKEPEKTATAEPAPAEKIESEVKSEEKGNAEEREEELPPQMAAVANEEQAGDQPRTIH